MQCSWKNRMRFSSSMVKMRLQCVLEKNVMIPLIFAELAQLVPSPTQVSILPPSSPLTHIPSAGNVRCEVCSPGWCTNTTYCILCPEGTYSNRTNSTECPACPDGFIAKNKNTTKCSSCRAGETSSPSHTVCHSCSPGTANPRYFMLTF